MEKCKFFIYCRHLTKSLFEGFKTRKRCFLFFKICFAERSVAIEVLEGDGQTAKTTIFRFVFLRRGNVPVYLARPLFLDQISVFYCKLEVDRLKNIKMARNRKMDKNQQRPPKNPKSSTIAWQIFDTQRTLSIDQEQNAFVLQLAKGLFGHDLFGQLVLSEPVDVKNEIRLVDLELQQRFVAFVWTIGNRDLMGKIVNF